MAPLETDANEFGGDSHAQQNRDSDLGRVQCPNCCRLAYVIRRNMGLLFYRCELCETVGATPDSAGE
jgi:hypothetical protein